MGIPGFQSWLRQRYPEAFGDLGPDDTFNHVYIDLQSTLHTVTRKARTRHGFHMLLHRRLDTLINTLGPTGRVVLAMDGPAPLAKLLEQRRRRRRESERSEHAEREAAAAADAGDGSAPHRHRAHGPRSHASGSSSASGYTPPTPGSAVSPLFLTTGTLFMLEVHNSLVYYICQRLTDPTYRHLHFELSDSTVKGEGELKILSRLLHTAGASSGDSAAAEESHVVVGGDSDLLVMAIASGQRHVTLWDDTPNRNRSGPRAHATAAFDRDRLEAIWRAEHLGPDATQADIAEMGLNMALLAIVCSGNDYLPGCNGMALQNKGRPGLWSLFLDMRRQEEWKDVSLVERTCEGCLGPSDSANGGECDGGGVAEVRLNRPALAALLRRYQDQRCMGPSDTGPFVKQDRVDGAWSFGMEHSNGNGGNGAAPAPGPPAAVLRPPAEPEEYIRGLEWVLSMYSSGSVSDYRFSYPAAPPLLPVLIDSLENGTGFSASGSEDISMTEGSESESEGYTDGEEAGERRSKRPSRTSSQPLIPAACALALLPARGRRQAATPLRHLMDADSPVAEIYAVCAECQGLARQVRSVAAQLDEVRGSLAALQGKLAGAGPDAEGAPTDAEGDLAAAAVAFEAAQDKLKDLMRELSRSQQEHFRQKHPFKPFPTEALEAAVAAVPSTRYPPRERRLARFGREMVFHSGDYAYLTSADTQEEAVEEGEPSALSGLERPDPPLPGWLRDAARFATAFPRIGNQDVIQGAAGAVVREILPLHPYMQPPGGAAGRRGGRPGAPSAIFMACQMRRYGSFGAVSSLSSLGPRALPYSGGGGFWGRAVGAPVMPAAALPAPAHAYSAPAASSSKVMQAALRTCARVLPRLRLLW